MIKLLIPIGITSLVATSLQGAGLLDYDAAIAGSGFEASLSTPVTFDDSNSQSAAFDFGAISGSATFEFILTGDPNLDGRTGQNGFIAVATGNSANSLRYEQWDNTGQLGFTRGGVADNTFTALEAASPTSDTHVTYRWTETGGTGTMDLFINGVAVDSIANAVFEMPSGPGLLGNNEGGNEGMVGTIFRVTTYNSALSDADIATHAGAFIPEPSSLLLTSLAAFGLLRRRR